MTTTYQIGSGQTYTTISSAITAIPSTLDDDYILNVNPGTYSETLSISKTTGIYSITLQGQLGDPTAAEVTSSSTTLSIQTSNIIIQDLTINTLSGGLNTGILIGSSSPGSPSDENILIQRCVIQKTGYISIQVGKGGTTIRNCTMDGELSTPIVLSNDIGDVKLLNNTILATIYRPIDNNSSTMTFKNNILVTTESDPVRFIDSYSYDIVADNNAYYAPNASSISFRADATTYSSFSAWQTAGYDNNGFLTDPDFYDQNGRNYRLNTSSPLLQQGADLSGDGVTVDLVNRSRPLNEAFEIGAFEMSQATPNPLLCWQLTAKRPNGKLFAINGPDSFPGLKSLNLPKLSEISVIEDGEKII